MYKNFFKLNSAPFKLTPDTACFFAEGSRKAILDALIYSVSNGDGICKVTGEVGSGKTLLSRLLAKSLPDKFEILYLLNPRISPDKILYAIAIELGLSIDYAENKVRLLHVLHSRLLELHLQDKQTVLLIDEAQTIPLETLEEIRMLGNLETGQHKLLQIVLFGQPELDKNLKKHEVRQIKERIIYNFYLPKLTVAEVGRYLYFRMQKAGFQGVFPFSGLAVRLIAMNSGGFLRRVNILADRCLLAAFSRQSRRVGVSDALKVIIEEKPLSKLVIAVVASAVIAGLVVGVQNYQHTMESNFFFHTVEKQKQASVLVDQPEEMAANSKLLTLNHVSMVSQVKPYTIQLLRVTIIENQDINAILKTMVPRLFWQHIQVYAETPQTFRVILGDYLTYADAEQKILDLPDSLRKNKPYVFKKGRETHKYQRLTEKSVT